MCGLFVHGDWEGENLGVERGLPHAILRQMVPLQRTTQRGKQRRHRQGGSDRSFLGSSRVSRPQYCETMRHLFILL